MLDIYNQYKDFKSFEVVFTNKGKELQKIFCSVKSIENNRIILDANNKQNHNVIGNVGDDLKIYIYTESGVYSSTSKVLLVTKGILNTEYVIAYPADSKHSQRREYFRADLSIDFEMNIIPEDESKPHITVHSKTKNMCGKGMSYVSNEEFPEYDLIDVNLFFEEKAINVPAKLVYSKEIYFGHHKKFIHAFMFTSISQKNVDFIVKKCFLHQLELKKKQTT